MGKTWPSVETALDNAKSVYVCVHANATGKRRQATVKERISSIRRRWVKRCAKCGGVIRLMGMPETAAREGDFVSKEKCYNGQRSIIIEQYWSNDGKTYLHMSCLGRVPQWQPGQPFPGF